MHGVKKTFDKWAQNGRAELMEKEHGNNVSKFLQTISFDKPFTFLDVGCGNGWVVRKIVKENNCKGSFAAMRKSVNRSDAWLGKSMKCLAYPVKRNR